MKKNRFVSKKKGPSPSPPPPPPPPDEGAENVALTEEAPSLKPVPPEAVSKEALDMKKKKKVTKQQFVQPQKGKGRINLLQRMEEAKENVDLSQAQYSAMNSNSDDQQPGLLSDIRAFKKSSLKKSFGKTKAADDYTFDEEEYELPKAKPMTLDYQKLYSAYLGEHDEAIPIHKLKFIILQISARSDTTLDFTGIAALTDITFALLADLMNKEAARLKAVTSVSLSGCHQITDAGIAWLGKAFPNLTWLTCAGCTLVTNTGILALSDLCPKLTSMDLSGTQVTFLPKRFTNSNSMRVTCTPFLFPTKISPQEKQPAMKPEGKDLFSVVIAHHRQVDVNLLNALKGEKQPDDNKISSVQYQGNVSLTSDITASIVETEQSLVPLFISNRSVVVIPSTLKDKSKINDEAASIASLIVQVRAKNPTAPFILVGCNTNAQGIVPTAVVKEKVLEMVNKLVVVIREKYPVLSSGKQEGVVENSDITKQLEISRAIALMERITNLKLHDLEINVDKADKSLASSIADAAKGMPCYKDISYDKEIYDWALSFPSKCPDGLKSGVVTLDAAAQTMSTKSPFKDRMRPFGAINFLRDIGQFCSWNNQEKRTHVANTEWLCKVLDTLMDVTRGKQTNNGQNHVIDDATPVWLMSGLKEEMAKVKASWDQVEEVIKSHSNVFLSNDKMLTPWTSLSLNSAINLDYFTNFNKDSDDDTCLHLMMSYALDVNVTPAFLHTILAHAVQLHAPVHVWQTGIVINDGIVAVMIAASGYTKVLNLCAYIPHYANDSKILKTLVWSTLNRYSIIIEYFLAEFGLQAEKLRRASKVLLPEPDRASGVLLNHTANLNVSGMCSDCHVSITEAAMLSEFDKALRPTLFNESTARVSKGSILGSVMTFSGKCVAPIKAYLDPIGNNKCCITLIQGVVRNLKFVFTCVRPQYKVILDLQEKKILYDSKSEDIANKLGEGTMQGCVLKTQIRGVGPYVMDFYMGPKLLASNEIPCGRYSINVDSTNLNEEEGTVASISVSDVSFTTRPTELKIGMRLEALDRKTPTLICVATIQDIKDDKILIHFDGWSAHYDFWTAWETEDLHPLGYMAHMRETNGHKKRVNKSLQIPNGYNKEFTWPKYLEEVDAEPVPYEFFNQEQAKGTPPNATDEALEYLGIFYKRSGSAADVTMCSRKGVTRNSWFKKKMKEAVKSASEKDVLKEDGFNWFTFLPTNLSVENLRYPMLKDVFDIKKMNVHFLCDWQGLEFHFSNHPGIPVAKTALQSDKWPALQLSSCIALLLQKENLPANPSNIIAGADQITKEKLPHLEMGLRRLIQAYITYGVILNHMSSDDMDETRLRDSFLEPAQKMVTTAMQNDKKFAQNFQFKAGSDGIMCHAHKLADSPQMDIQEIKIENFLGLTSRIYHLNMNSNPLNKVPEDLFTHFNNLTNLSLNKCNITELPSFAQNISLEEIDVRNNKLTSLPDDIDQLKSLKVLQISNNPLEILPLKISSLTTLVHLAADNIGKVDLNIVCKLVKLDFLSVSFNHIDEIPEKFGELPLQTLYMAGLPIMSQSSSFAASSINSLLDSIVVYNRILAKDRQEMIEKADNNGDNNTSKIIEFNKLLQEKYPQFNKTKGFKDGEIPPIILQLSKLQKLHLSNQLFTTVPDTVKQLESLQSLNLESNPRLESVSAELANLPLKELHLRNCTSLKTPPKEVVRRGFLAVFGFLKRLLQGSVLCKRTKLMMVGLGGAGKTSLVRALTHKAFRYNESLEENITDGIDITEWSVNTQKFPSVNDESSNEPLRFSVWDFAGQTVYYNTHQFFLSNRAVYLLLWNIRLGFEHAGLDFWLSSVACHAPKAPIVVVGTHCDKVERGKLPVEELKRKFPKIVAFHFVSSFTGEGINDLRVEVINSALKQEYMGEKIPEAWLSLETGLDKVRGKKSLIKWEEIEEVATTAGIFDKAELTQSVQFLHDLGSVQFFNTPFLKSHVVIVPQWIVDVMACIVTVHDGPTKDGKLRYTDMAEVWKDYPKELHPWLLRLTEEFDLTFPISNEDANIVPCLLSDSEPKYEFAPINKDKRERESQMVYRFEYLPAGLFNRAQVRLHQFSDTSLMWKKGFMLKKNDHRALLLQMSNTEVDVTARGYKPENIIFLIHEVIESLIADSYAGVSYDFSLPCLDCASNFTLEPSMFHASKVKRALEMKAPFLQCDKQFHVISIPEIRAAMPPDRHSDFDEHLGRSVRELQELEEGVSIKCLFIYSKKNVPDLAHEGKVVNPVEILADLRKDGFNVTYCDDPETANMESMTLAIKSAQNVIIGISDDFVTSEQCKNLIIYIKKTLNKTITLLVLGSTTNWQKTDINLVLADELFVRMADMKSYPVKIKELKEAIRTKVLKKKVTYPDCFISYCWANSASAVELGMAEKEGALGWADPRKIKDFLQEKGVNCWLDVNQMGQEGFFEDIAEGLRKAKVMVACVSDEYANSKNCKMEFRFALSTLKIPTVLAVVGTGYLWERSEIGLLTVGHSNSCPKINLQYPNEGGMLDLLKAVQSFIPVEDKDKKDKEKNKKSQQDIAFQEVLELAQRKLLRQIMMYADNLDSEEYPRLIIIDFKSNDKKRPKSSKTPEIKEDKTDRDCSHVDELPMEHGQTEDVKPKSDTYCFRLFCEHELGWHESPETISMPLLESAAMSDFLSSVSAYAVRLMAILKHTKSDLPVFSTPAGEQFQRKMEEWCTRTNSDFQSEYHVMLERILDEDIDRTYGGLKKCNMPNKKSLWLCPKHEKHSFTQTEEKYKDEIKTDVEETSAAAVDDTDVESDNFTESSSVISELSLQEKPQVDEKKVRYSSITVAQPARGPALPPSRPKINRHTSGKKTSSQACRLM